MSLVIQQTSPLRGPALGKCRNLSLRCSSRGRIRTFVNSSKVSRPAWLDDPGPFDCCPKFYRAWVRQMRTQRPNIRTCGFDRWLIVLIPARQDVKSCAASCLGI
jgi:hypothetical protein